jgi:VWFA-related protein
MGRCLKGMLIVMFVCSLHAMQATQDDAARLPTATGNIQEIKVKTELMEVRTVVTNQKGAIIENLSKDDFELLENEKPQEISFFSVSEIEKDRIVPEKPGTSTRTRERLSAPPVRTTLLFVDNLHLSFSSLNRVKESVRRFIKEHLTEQDAVALATSGQTLGLAQQFTRDRQLLSYAVEQIRFGPKYDDLFTPTLAADVIAERGDGLRLAVDMMRKEYNMECPCARLLGFAHNRAVNILSQASYSRKTTLSILKDFAEQMIRLPGKRMIVVFSDGFTLLDSDSSIHNEDIRAAVDRAVRSGVVIYSIDAKGLQIPPTFDAGRRLMTTDPNNHPWTDETSAAPPTGPGNGSTAGTNSALTTNPDCAEEALHPPDSRCFAPDAGMYATFVNTSEREEQNGLYAIADQTGGKLFTNTNNLGDALERAFDANRFYYVLSYYLPPGSDARTFRNIKVRVRNHPDYTVRTARGYSLSDTTAGLEAEAAKTPQQRLIQAMRSPLPMSDLGVSAQADYIEEEVDDKQVSLIVYFDGDRFQYTQKDQRNFVELEILSAFYDTSGRQVDAVSAHVEGRLTDSSLIKARTSGFRFTRRLALQPGVYQARIGVREEGTDRMGTATAWVEIPEIRSGKLSMSSLILHSALEIDSERAAGDGIEVSELEQIRMVQGMPLYERGNFCDYSFRVHQGTEISTPIAVMVELLQDGKTVRQEPWRKVKAEEKTSDKKGWFDLDGEVDLNGLSAGIYELRVTLKETQSNRSVQRATVFGLE